MKHRHLTGLVVALVLVLAAFTGSAFAGGNGNGNGGGNGKGNQTEPTTPAPAAAPAPAQPAPATHGNSGSKKSDTSASNPATGGTNATGVKPSSTTKHDTYAKASSNQTKQYGNGKTAGQIATQAGHGDATLHGPGNSQPHKTNCGSKHEVDVHALKNKGSQCGSTATATAAATTKVESKGQAKHEAAHEAKAETKSSAQVGGAAAVAGRHVTICHATGSASHPYVMISPSVSGVFHGHLGHQDARDIIPAFTYNGQTYSQNMDSAGLAIFKAGCTVTASSTTQVQATQTQTPAAAAAPAAATAASAPATAGGVKGATATLTKPKAKPAGGVLGATTRLGGTVASTNLPFTGLPLWIFAALAALLILVGATVRRSASDRV